MLGADAGVQTGERQAVICREAWLLPRTPVGCGTSGDLWPGHMVA